MDSPISLPDDFSGMDATAQATLVRRRKVSATELVQAAIRRIERIDPAINAVVTPMYEAALERARTGSHPGPFSGVPFLVKDSAAACAGVRMASGSRLLQHHIPMRHSELVARYRQAGLIVLGKTNCSEFGLLPTTEPRLFGATRNPWNLDCTPGGSSGGSAAAVAAGMVPMAHGSDGGGSLRIPASCCGLFGLKPSRARNPAPPDRMDVHARLVAEHVLTRSVRDSAALLDATQGAQPGDLWNPPSRLRPFREEVGADPGPLRIAVGSRTTAPLHPDCADALRDAAALCEGLGHRVIDAQPVIDLERAARLFTTLWAAGCAATLDNIARGTNAPLTAADTEEFTWALYGSGRRIGASEYQLALADLQAMAGEVARFFADYDVWLTPVTSAPPPRLGSFDPAPGDAFAPLRKAWAYAPMAALCNITGQPAMSVPLYWNKEGLPVGSHFAGRFGDEATLFRLASQLEKCRPWADRRPAAN